MDWSALVIAGITAVAAILKVLLDRNRLGGTRSRIQRDLEMLALMPDGDAKAALTDFIEERVVGLTEAERTKSRDPTGIVLALGFLAVAVWMSVQAFQDDGSKLWFVGTFFLGLLGLFGLSQDAVPRERDERGRPTRSSGA